MKTIKLTLLLLVLSNSVFAQQPKQIFGIAKEDKTKAYYQEQSQLWQKETQTNSKNANAWYNYYRAQRAYLQKADIGKWNNNQQAVLKALEPIITNAEKRIGKTYEYNLIKSMNFNYKDKEASMPFLIKAYNIDSSRTEVYEDLFIHYVMANNNQKATEIAQKMLAANSFANATYMWNYNALQTAAKNGVYITQGDLDTIPRWLLQYGENLRKDVLVVNVPLLATNTNYRKMILAKLGVSAFGKQESSFNHHYEYKEALVSYVVKHVVNTRPVYFDCGTGVDFFDDLGIKNDVYVVGASFLYSKTKVDNLALIKKNFEKVYDLGYIKNNFQSHPENDVVKKYFNIAYIPGLMKLKKHYEIAGEVEKTKKYGALINVIAQESGRKEEIMSWYK